MNETPQDWSGPERVGALTRLAAALLDYVMSTLLTMLVAWKGWGWQALVEDLQGLEELMSLYEPVEEALVEAGLMGGVMGLLGATALMSVVYPLVEGLTGASPGKWILGLRVGRQNGASGDVVLYLKRFAVKFIRPVMMALSAATGVGLMAWLSGPAGTVMAIGTLLLLSSHKQALHDKLVGTAVYRRVDLEGV
ncbi:MAG: RDD family protein [Bacteroidetes bacterium]|nr:RDD family protein [Bacteroidota bacterium]